MTGFTRLIAPVDFGDSTIGVASVVSRGDGKNVVTPLEIPTIPDCVSRAPNIGLLWQRYLPAHDSKELPESRGWKSLFGVDFSAFFSGRVKGSSEIAKDWAGRGVLRWFVAAAGRAQEALCVQPTELLSQLMERRRLLLRKGGPMEEFWVANRWRTAIGLGNAATLENSGVILHHTYGFPVLPGSSLKGLARHYLMEQLQFEDDDEFSRLRKSVAREFPTADMAELLFGREKSDDGSDSSDPSGTETVGSESASNDPVESSISPGEGLLSFHDGWPVLSNRSRNSSDDNWFDVDVLTVHHANYYSQSDGQPAADDTEGPNPVHFLALRPGVTFCVPISLTSPGRRYPLAIQKDLLKAARRILLLALDQWGIGGKSGAGYGRMFLVGADE